MVSDQQIVVDLSTDDVACAMHIVIPCHRLQNLVYAATTELTNYKRTLGVERKVEIYIRSSQ